MYNVVLLHNYVVFLQITVDKMHFYIIIYLYLQNAGSNRHKQ